ncbi:MAG TPA: twin-arginine translocase TatA/TatE family subunit [Candidatus Sulfotelmatobacter sp.]|nr:twin-arginine translocase TatA/TatE family subunit [Candidatus Sulfotelmatobacter sp.]
MSFSETVFLFFLALIIFGPKKLPEIARQVGKFMNEFRRASNEFKSQIEQEIAHLEVEKQPTILPPAPLPGTASRTLHAVDAEVKPVEETATLAAPAEEPAASTGERADTTLATEAANPADVVTSSTSQESHA